MSAVIPAEVLEQLAVWLDGYVQEGYSGRGMYGATCPAVVTSQDGVAVGFAIGLIVAHQYGDESAAEEMAFDSRHDSMGHDIVYYWPRLTLEH